MDSIEQLLPIVKKDFPEISFLEGESFIWSPKTKTISYSTHQQPDNQGVWSLLHEIAHAELGHANYNTDFSLLRIETDAWTKAEKIASNYNIVIDPNHIQDCLDTYRDWLHKRAKCPTCSVVSIQRKDLTYQCFNCTTLWKVPRSPICRIRRQVVKIEN